MSVEGACRTAVAAAGHVEADGVDAGAVEALYAVARKIDAWDVIVEWALDDAGSDGRPKVPAHDNTSLTTLLKWCESLGLTTVSRQSLTGPVKVEVDPLDELHAQRKRRVAGSD